MDKRFQKIRHLGQGGRGTVSLVRDHHRKGLLVALKRPIGGKDQFETAALEFERTARLRHPNLARAFDFGSDDEGVYFTSEYVEGASLDTWSEGASLEAKVNALGGLLRALSLLHDRDIVHGDVSFGNVRISCKEADTTKRGCGLKLLDLGEAGRPGSISGAAVAGFAAPEILSGRGALFPSDLYAFGAVASEVLLGTKPFGTGDASEIVRRQLSGECSLPEPSASPLVSLIRELLTPDPASRPQSAAEVLRRLSESTEIALPFDLASLNADDLPAPRLIERERELASLYDFVEQMDNPTGGRIGIVEGPTGTGRSAVLWETGLFARRAGFGVIGRIGPSGREDHLLADLCRACNTDALSEEARRVLAPWRLSNASPPSSNSDAAVVNGEISRVVFAALEALVVASQNQPQLVLVDDWETADTVTRETVLALARSSAPERPGRPRAAILLATDTETAATLTEQFPVIAATRALTRSGTDSLAASMLPGVAIPSSFSEALYLESSGIPKTAEELVRQAAGTDFELSATVSDIKTACLDKHAQTALAVLGSIEGAHPEQVLFALNLTEPMITDLVHRGFLTAEESPESVLYAPSGAAATRIRKMVDADDFKNLAGHAAAVLSRAELYRQAGSLWAAAHAPKDAHDAFRAAAAERRAQGDLLGAAEWLERAVGQWDGGFDLRDTAREAVETWRTVGRFDAAIHVLKNAGYSAARTTLIEAAVRIEQGRHREAETLLAKTTPTETDKREIAALKAACALQLGNHENALATVTEALPDSGPDTPETAQLALIGGTACVYLGRTELADKLLGRAESGFDRYGDTAGQLKVFGNKGMLYRRKGDLAEARRLYDKAVEKARLTGDRPREGLHRMNRATVAHAACSYEDAYRDYLAASEIADILGNDFRAAQVEINLSDLLVDLGETETALRIATRALKRCRALSQGRLEARALLTAGRACIAGGDLFRGELRLDEARRRFSAAGDESGRAFADIRIAELLLARGDFTRAEAAALSAKEANSATGRHRETARALVIAAKAVEKKMSLETALSFLESAEHALKHEPAPDTLMEIQLHRARIFEKLNRTEEQGAAVDKAKGLFQAIFEKVPDAFRDNYLSRISAPELSPQVDAPKAEPSVRWTRDLEMLVEINRELTAEHDPKRLLHLIMESAVNLTGAERGMVVMPRSGALEPVISYQIAEEADRNFSRSVADKVVREGRAVLTVDAMGDERFRAFVSVNALKLRSILAVPLKIRRRVVGVVYLDSRLQTGVFSDADRRLLEAFGAQAAVCLETARLIAENQTRYEALTQANEEIQTLTEKLKDKLHKNEARLERVGALLEKTQATASAKLKKGGMVGASLPMQQIRKLISRIAPANVPVYIYGASGTGKELAARAIHSESERNAKPFVAVNCGALPSKLLAGELFGHKKGAFTGAVSDRPGLFRIADKGTLFLDEVSDMDKEMQTHLLRVLQDGSFRSLGDNEENTVDVRIIAASNRDLETEVKEGRFREDLYYRLNVVRIDLPPLSERREDIPLLIEALSRRQCGDRPIRFTKEAVNLLTGAEWPGNVRELENEILRSVTMAADPESIGPADLSPRFTAALRGDTWKQASGLKDQVAIFEETLIRRKVAECGGNASKAARQLGISRATLYKKLEKTQEVGIRIEE